MTLLNVFQKPRKPKNFNIRWQPDKRHEMFYTEVYNETHPIQPNIHLYFSIIRELGILYLYVAAPLSYATGCIIIFQWFFIFTLLLN